MITMTLSDGEYRPSEITEDELFDGQAYDFYTLYVSSQREYDYLRSLELMRGDTLEDLVLIPEGTLVNLEHGYILEIHGL